MANQIESQNPMDNDNQYGADEVQNSKQNRGMNQMIQDINERPGGGKNEDDEMDIEPVSAGGGMGHRIPQQQKFSYAKI